MTNEITISLGSNVNPRDNLKRAGDLIKNRFNLLKSSKIYSSKSKGFVGEDFLNQVILCDTELTFENVIKLLKGIEVSMGRKKEKIKFSDRLIDLDLLTFGEKIIKKNNQEVPHKDIEKYSFVLVPLAEICPRKIHPLNGLTFKEMLIEKKNFYKEVKVI
jgi:2-amino-4-hydroxy-6-hydroxymethyldihydropteridine diphosphokinase